MQEGCLSMLLTQERIRQVQVAMPWVEETSILNPPSSSLRPATKEQTLVITKSWRADHHCKPSTIQAHWLAGADVFLSSSSSFEVLKKKQGGGQIECSICLESLGGEESESFLKPLGSPTSLPPRKCKKSLVEEKKMEDPESKKQRRPRKPKPTEVAALCCGHYFHFKCAKSWLKSHPSCPHCRGNPILLAQKVFIETYTLQVGERGEEGGTGGEGKRKRQEDVEVLSPVKTEQERVSLSSAGTGGEKSVVEIDSDEDDEVQFIGVSYRST